MTISGKKIYPRKGDTQTVYLKNVIKGQNIEIGDHTMYNDFVNDPRDFERNNVLYHYPINSDRLMIGKSCSIACSAKFILNSANQIYIIADSVLVLLYCAIWAVCFKKSSVFRALALSIIPSVLFLFSAVMIRSIPLMIAAVLFAPSHIMISCKNAKQH